MSIFRLTGTVIEANARRGVSKSSGEPYEIPFAVVQIAPFLRTQVNLSDALVDKLTAGDVVDLVCEVTASGGYLRAQALDAWPESAAYPLHAAG